MPLAVFLHTPSSPAAARTSPGNDPALPAPQWPFPSVLSRCSREKRCCPSVRCSGASRPCGIPLPAPRSYKQAMILWLAAFGLKNSSTRRRSEGRAQRRAAQGRTGGLSPHACPLASRLSGRAAASLWPFPSQPRGSPVCAHHQASAQLSFCCYYKQGSPKRVCNPNVRFPGAPGPAASRANASHLA